MVICTQKSCESDKCFCVLHFEALWVETSQTPQRERGRERERKKPHSAEARC